eukprot:gene3215-2197_t
MVLIETGCWDGSYEELTAFSSIFFCGCFKANCFIRVAEAHKHCLRLWLVLVCSVVCQRLCVRINANFEFAKRVDANLWLTGYNLLFI